MSYNTAIAACDKLRDAEAAVRLLQQARENDIVPDMFSYNTVISALSHSSLWQVGGAAWIERAAGLVRRCKDYRGLC